MGRRDYNNGVIAYVTLFIYLFFTIAAILSESWHRSESGLLFFTGRPWLSSTMVVIISLH